MFSTSILKEKQAETEEYITFSMPFSAQNDLIFYTHNYSLLLEIFCLSEDGAAASSASDLGLRLPVLCDHMIHHYYNALQNIIQILCQHDRQQGGRGEAARGSPHLPG